MTEPRLLVTGADGQVGRALRAFLPRADYRSRRELDVTDEAAVERSLEGVEVVVHAGAMTNVDACEARPDEAWAVNERGTHNIATAAHARGAKVVFLSTDYVFPGDDPPYEEDDQTRPVNVYGRTKDAAEGHLDLERDLVVRTSWVFGGERNFVRAILEAARTKVPNVVDDQAGRPTAAADLARALAHLVHGEGLVGRLHVAGDGPPCSRADLADEALARAGIGIRVARIDSASYAASTSGPVAPRPPNTTLELERARRYGVPLVDWRTSLDEYVKGLA